MFCVFGWELGLGIGVFHVAWECLGSQVPKSDESLLCLAGLLLDFQCFGMFHNRCRCGTIFSILVTVKNIGC